MNLPNVVAVGFVALAIGTSLLAVVLGAAPLFMDVEHVLRESEKMGSPPLPEQQTALFIAFPWLTAVTFFCFFAFPAAFLGAAGFGMWRLVGRRRVDAMATAASQQPTQERSLQEAFDRGIRRVLTGDSQGEEALLLRYQRLLLVLDPSRQGRLLLFARTLGLPGVEGLVSPQTSDSPSMPSAQRVLLGRIAALFCLLITAFIAFWPITMILIAPVIRELYGITLGMDLGTEDLVVAVAMLLGLGSIPLAFGLGLLHLSRLENLLLSRWQEHRREAESLLLEALQRQVRHLQAVGLEPQSGRQKCRLALRSLVVADFHDLAERGRQVLAETLLRAGLGTFVPTPWEGQP